MPDRSVTPSGTWTARRVRAEALNLAGRWAFRVGSRLVRVGGELCGLGGKLDAMADQADYWKWHR